jgi:nucleotide-binding universal stress UspA family protein
MVTDVVVGVDGSPESDDALAWALTEARRRHLAVRAINVRHPGHSPAEVEWLAAQQSIADLRAQLVQEVSSDVRAVAERVAATDVPVTCEVLYGHPADELIRTAGTDSLHVVGSRGRGSLTGTMLGSVSQSSAQYGNGTVVVVRGRGSDATARPVVVGVDGSSASIAALRFADEAARLRGATLRVVHAWTMPYLGFAGPATRLPQDAIDDLHGLAEAALRESIDRASLDVSKSTVELSMVHGGAAPSLLQAAEDADLLVVGSRGFGGWKGLLLGSVSMQSVTQSPCTVAVVRDPASGDR